MAYTKEQIRSIFQSHFNVGDWTNFIINFFNAKTLKRVPEKLDIDANEGEGFYWGSLSTSDGYEISFFYVKTNRAVDNRKVGLRQLVSKYIKIDSDAGIAVFDDGNHWRLSFITDLREEKTSPKRFTFVLGDNNNYYNTPVERFVELQRKGITFANIKEAFSVEALTKQFYNELFDWYTWALKEDTGVYFPNDPNTKADDREDLDTKMIRLITRLMFVWFIKQKGLVPDALFNPSEISHWLNDFDPQSMESANYYQAILQNLFFATLNRPIKTITYDKDGNEKVERRGFAELKGKSDVKSLYRYKELFKITEDKILSLFEFIPFINGGLFECLDKNKTSDGVEKAFYHDGFSRNNTIKGDRFTHRAFVPNKLFFDKEDGLFSIFNRYNFTVEENSPNEQQVALDPELLGKVFENLLGTYNPETEKTARKSSGSFYTPREIVNYMIDNSLISYLGGSDKIKNIFSPDFEYDETDKDEYITIIEKLKSITVLDPACGSGAFPMGMLNRIVDILIKLKAEGSKYELKLQVMENCIYGNDIQQIAAQITKLRFFISLICECEKNDNADDNFGIPNLPNLETHLVCADSLASFDEEGHHPMVSLDVLALQEELRKVRHDHFTAKSVYMKNKLRNKDYKLRNELAEMLSQDGVYSSNAAKLMAEWNPYDQNSKARFFDADWMFGIKQFDIVIGNPPYFQINKGVYSKGRFPYSEGKDVGKQNLYKMFVEHSYNMAKDKTGIACMIVQSSLMCDLSSKHTRELLLKHTQLEYVIEFPKTAPTKEGQVFESVCQGTCIYQFIKKRPTGDAFLLSVDNDCTTLGKLNIEKITQQSLLDFYPEDFAIPLLKNGEFVILKHIKSNPFLSLYISSVSQGDFNLSNNSSQYSESRTNVKLLRGNNVSDYNIDYDVNEFVNEGFRKEYVLKNKESSFILSQAITGTTDKKRVHCALSDPGETFLCGHSINKTLLKEDKLNYVILGLLNSKLMDWTFRRTSTNNNVNGYELRQLPIKIPESFAIFEAKVKKIVLEVGNGYDLTNEVKELDILIYKLYNLPFRWVIVIDNGVDISEEEYNAIEFN